MEDGPHTNPGLLPLPGRLCRPRVVRIRSCGVHFRAEVADAVEVFVDSRKPRDTSCAGDLFIQDVSQHLSLSHTLFHCLCYIELLHTALLVTHTHKHIHTHARTHTHTSTGSVFRSLVQSWDWKFGRPLTRPSTPCPLQPSSTKWSVCVCMFVCVCVCV